MRILVTGANGFVGTALCERLSESGHSVIEARRVAGPDVHSGGRNRDFSVIGDIGANPPWDLVLPGVDVVVHLAALVHQMGEPPSLEAYRRVNVEGTVQLANAAVRHGVRRIVFLSSIKVNGEITPGASYTERDAPLPGDAYGVSKQEAEAALTELGREGKIETVLVRPPLVYGPGVRANFLRLMATVQRMNPVIVPRFTGRRSMIALANLVDLLAVCTSHPKAANELFLTSDNEDITVSDLILRLARIMNRKALSVPVPQPLLRALAKALGKEPEIRRLMDPLTVSPEKAMRVLGWVPPVDVNAGLAFTVDWYRRSVRNP